MAADELVNQFSNNSFGSKRETSYDCFTSRLLRKSLSDIVARKYSGEECDRVASFMK